MHIASPLPWLRPSDAMRVALLLHGKVGELKKPSSFTAADGGDPIVVRTAHAAIMEHLVRANPRAAFTTFAHSWNPSLASVIDALYRPAWSAHEREHLLPMKTGLRVHSPALAQPAQPGLLSVAHQAAQCACMKAEFFSHSPLPAHSLHSFVECCERMLSAAGSASGAGD